MSEEELERVGTGGDGDAPSETTHNEASNAPSGNTGPDHTAREAATPRQTVSQSAYIPPVSDNSARKSVTVRLDTERVGLLRRVLSELPGYRSENQLIVELLEPQLAELERVYRQDGYRGVMLWIADQRDRNGPR